MRPKSSLNSRNSCSEVNTFLRKYSFFSSGRTKSSMNPLILSEAANRPCDVLKSSSVQMEVCMCGKFPIALGSWSSSRDQWPLTFPIGFSGLFVMCNIHKLSISIQRRSKRDPALSRTDFFQWSFSLSHSSLQ